MEDKYYKTKDSVEEYIELAKDVNSEELIERLRSILPPDSALLEIGSGSGTDWNILSETYKVIGSDNSSEFLSHLIDKYPNGKFFELDAVTLNTDNKFDGIYSNKVIGKQEWSDRYETQFDDPTDDGQVGFVIVI